MSSIIECERKKKTKGKKKEEHIFLCFLKFFFHANLIKCVIDTTECMYAFRYFFSLLMFGFLCKYGFLNVLLVSGALLAGVC